MEKVLRKSEGMQAFRSPHVCEDGKIVITVGPLMEVGEKG